MQVKIRMMGTLRQVSGVDKIFIDDEYMQSVKDSVKLMVNNYPALEEELIDPLLKTPEPNALILLDGIDINNLNGLDTSLRDGSELVILSVTHGG
jgi:molybdopterin converting factor small subunit